MFTHDARTAMAALEVSPWRRCDNHDWARRAALKLYRRSCRRGWLHRIRSRFRGQAYHLFDLGRITSHQAIPGYPCLGTRPVDISHIKGSEGRSSDFDRGFHPRCEHNRDRWLGVAVARRMGVSMPPVCLIQIGNAYFVRDGHHRISVAQAMGQQYIEAEVTVWHARGPLPWEQEVTALPLWLQLRRGTRTATRSYNHLEGGVLR